MLSVCQDVKGRLKTSTASSLLLSGHEQRRPPRHFLGLGMTRTFGVARTFGVFLGLGLTRTFGVFKPQTQIAFPYVQTVSNVHLAVYPKPENKKLNELLTSKPAYPERHRGRPIAHRVRSRTEARGTGGTETGGTEPCSPPRAK